MPRQHRCFRQVDKKLAEHNTRLARNLLDHNQLIIGTEVVDDTKREGRGCFKRKPKPAMLFASHCPFCGEKLKVKDGL